MSKALFLFVTFFGLNAAAQSSANTLKTTTKAVAAPSDSSVHVIPTVGLAVMGLKTDSSSINPDNGVTAGGLVELGNGLATGQTGVLYNQFGIQQNSRQANLNYLAIPVMGKLNFMGNPEKTFFLKAGVMPSFLVGSTLNTPRGSISGGRVGATPFDIPVVIGLGGAIPVGPTVSLVIEANYVRSLVNINDKGTTNAKNEGLLIGSGLSIAL